MPAAVILDFVGWPGSDEEGSRVAGLARLEPEREMKEHFASCSTAMIGPGSNLLSGWQSFGRN